MPTVASILRLRHLSGKLSDTAKRLFRRVVASREQTQPTYHRSSQQFFSSPPTRRQLQCGGVRLNHAMAGIPVLSILDEISCRVLRGIDKFLHRSFWL